MNKDKRNEYIEQAYRNGETLKRIGDDLGLSRERIRQILRAMRVPSEEGGQALQSKVFRSVTQQHKLLKAAQKAERLGITTEELALIEKKYGGYSSGNPFKRYTQHRKNASQRGVPWEFDNFGEWWNIWKSRYDNRGRRSASLVMARINDLGPYSPDNVKIVTQSENISEGRKRYFQRKRHETVDIN